MREDHGVTVPLSSFRTRDAVQGRKDKREVDGTKQKE